MDILYNIIFFSFCCQLDIEIQGFNTRGSGVLLGGIHARIPCVFMKHLDNTTATLYIQLGYRDLHLTFIYHSVSLYMLKGSL